MQRKYYLAEQTAINTKNTKYYLAEQTAINTMSK
jgi:hypothetical protein